VNEPFRLDDEIRLGDMVLLYGVRYMLTDKTWTEKHDKVSFIFTCIDKPSMADSDTGYLKALETLDEA